ncbi:hypothetical protein IGI04_002333 [Brassica rapa subsp. trilocularis]|uniref:Uncharacterized protein n=1 Tax=Brassica rapa subsp. trilocularis TaxID=1813537 RepID=A0ABQ7NV81_BRACM|nr:hypothetical protein IGI04_002333 [Brassica rapa subsp. trilocularis]
MGTRNCIRQESALHSEVGVLRLAMESIAMGNGEHASIFDMSKLWNGLQRFDLHDKGVSCLAKLCNIMKEDSDSEDMLPRLQNHSYSTSAKSDFRFFS